MFTVTHRLDSRTMVSPTPLLMVDLSQRYSLQPRTPLASQMGNAEEVISSRLSTSALTDTWQAMWENDTMPSGKVSLI